MARRVCPAVKRTDHATCFRKRWRSPDEKAARQDAVENILRQNVLDQHLAHVGQFDGGLIASRASSRNNAASLRNQAFFSYCVRMMSRSVSASAGNILLKRSIASRKARTSRLS